MKFVLFVESFIFTFVTGNLIRCYQCIQGMAADAEDATNENIPLPKNLTLPGVKTLPRDYCKTPFELKDNVLCKAAGRCMKSVTYEKDNKFIIRYCAPRSNEYGFEESPSIKKPIDITNGCYKFRAYICNTDLCNDALRVANPSLLILILPFFFL